ncbi:MAG TPA: DUF1932 domain-containing protein [Actinopolymorphaceae bacterium]|jgi:3-hydroxyisobutyrate dehydrogenase-like beta-hydroxyacid dehydrogenase
METVTVGVLHPGEMGAAVARQLVTRGHQVLYASHGRSAKTRSRAEAAGLKDVRTPAALLRECAVILSICPPHAALSVASELVGYPGVYVDANAISPKSAREVGALLEPAGAHVVDGGIIGGPPERPGTTRLYVSGGKAETVVELFAGTALAVRNVGNDVGHASALKMCYAAWTKGTSALLLAVRAAARAEGVEADLLAEWELSQPTLADRSVSAARSAYHKGWRWRGEMEEIAATLAAAGLPAGFHQAAAEIFGRCPRPTEEVPADVFEQVAKRLMAS